MLKSMIYSSRIARARTGISGTVQNLSYRTFSSVSPPPNEEDFDPNIVHR